MGFGKHTTESIKIKELEKTIELKDKEISDIKKECSKQFLKIKDLCFSNDYNGKFDILRKIYEIASDNYNTLVVDMIINDTEEKPKIIELPNTRKSK